MLAHMVRATAGYWLEVAVSVDAFVVLRCKHLMQNIQPELLQVGIAGQVELTHRHVWTDDVTLYGWLVERAPVQ